MFWRQFNLTDRIFLFVCLRCCLKRKDECLWCHQRISHVKQDYFLIRLCNFQDIFFLIEMISNRCFIVQKKKYKLQVIFHIDIRRKYDFFFSSLFFLTNLHPRRKLSFRNLLNFFSWISLYCIYCCSREKIRCNEKSIVWQGIEYKKT
jgi:hypothetical protein